MKFVKSFGHNKSKTNPESKHQYNMTSIQETKDQNPNKTKHDHEVTAKITRLILCGTPAN